MNWFILEIVVVGRLHQPTPASKLYAKIEWCVSAVSLQQMRLACGICSHNWNCEVLFTELKNFKNALTSRCANWNISQSFAFPSFPPGKRKRQLALGDWHAVLPDMCFLALISVASWSWLSGVLYSSLMAVLLPSLNIGVITITIFMCFDIFSSFLPCRTLLFF